MNHFNVEGNVTLVVRRQTCNDKNSSYIFDIDHNLWDGWGLF